MKLIGKGSYQIIAYNSMEFNTGAVVVSWMIEPGTSNSQGTQVAWSEKSKSG